MNKNAYIAALTAALLGGAAPANARQGDLINIHFSVLYADVEYGPDDEQLHMRFPPDKNRGVQNTSAEKPSIHIVSEDDYRVDDDRWYLHLGPGHSISGKEDAPVVALAKALATPKLSVVEGHWGGITVGERMTYFEKRDDGLFELKTSRDIVDGFTISVDNPRQTADGGVSFGELRLKISTILEREKIEGVPFDVGRPQWRSASFGFTPTIPSGSEIAIIRVPDALADEGMLFIAVQVEVDSGS